MSKSLYNKRNYITQQKRRKYFEYMCVNIFFIVRLINIL